jgi:hypothetical protein
MRAAVRGLPRATCAVNTPGLRAHPRAARAERCVQPPMPLPASAFRAHAPRFRCSSCAAATAAPSSPVTGLPGRLSALPPPTNLRVRHCASRRPRWAPADLRVRHCALARRGPRSAPARAGERRPVWDGRERMGARCLLTGRGEECGIRLGLVSWE